MPSDRILSILFLKDLQLAYCGLDMDSTISLESSVPREKKVLISKVNGFLHQAGCLQ